MIPNNNFSVLPWYKSIEEQNARKWWIYNRVYPLFSPAGFILPFQILIPHVRNNPQLSSFLLTDANTGATVANITTAMRNTGLQAITFATFGYDVVVYPGIMPINLPSLNGRYYIIATIDSVRYYSEIFTVVNDIEPYLKITWWDIDDFVMDAGRIVYNSYVFTTFKNVLYLQSDIAKPEYIFEEEGETRDGYFFPIKQISEKRYRFAFLASEYLLDVMRFIRMADYAEIEYHGQQYKLDTFLITPEWESDGDVATVEAVFDTATVAKKIGRGYQQTGTGGDFNNDFNDDFNNN